MSKFTLLQRLKFYASGRYYDSIGWYLRPKPRSTAFKFNDITYVLSYIKTDHAYRTERVVEIPLGKEFIIRHHHKNRLLEVGNTMQYYMFDTNIWWDIVDKYEKHKGVLNEDILEFSPKEKYDAILSISTLEHVGFDEEPQDDSKSLKAFESVYNLLKPKGNALITVPLGYNPEIDRLLSERILEKRIKGTKIYYLNRISPYNEWSQTSEYTEVKYGYPFNNANKIAIITMRKD